MEIVISLGEGKSIRFPKEGGVTSVGLKEDCPQCGQPDCYKHYNYAATPSSKTEDEQEMIQRRACNAAIDAVESLLLSLANAGLIKLANTSTSPVYDTRLKDAVQETLDAIANHVED
jgi:hypothetical protein